MSLNQPFASIIMPVYNRAHILARAVESVMLQSFANWELIIIDDGSTDLSTQVIANYMFQDCRIRFVPAVHAGQAIARNLGLKQARGQYVTFIDSDDEYLPEHLQLHLEHFQKNNELKIVFSDFMIIGDELLPDKDVPEKMISVYELNPGWSVFVKKDLIISIGGFPELAYAEDTAMVEKLLRTGAPFVKTANQTYKYYRTEPDSICNVRQQELLAA